MQDFLSLGPTPAGVSCEAVGKDYRETVARAECRAFIEQLTRVFGTPPGEAYFRVKSCPHDFGTYLDVVIMYDPAEEAEADYAFKCEGDTPTEWDQQAQTELMQQLGVSYFKQKENSNESS